MQRLFEPDALYRVMPQAKFRLYVNQMFFSTPSMMHSCFGILYTGIDTWDRA